MNIIMLFLCVCNLSDERVWLQNFCGLTVRVCLLAWSSLLVGRALPGLYLSAYIYFFHSIPMRGCGQTSSCNAHV